MADMFLFVKYGWENIWKHKTIWLFSALPLFSLVFYLFQITKESSLFELMLRLVLILVSAILYLINFIGVPYLVFCFSIGKPVTIQETLFAVRKFSGRVIGCSCLGFILIFPLISWIFASSINNSTNTYSVSKNSILFMLPLSLFSAIWDFSLFGFFANNWGIRKSVNNAWDLFKSHFRVLAALGIGAAVILVIYSAASGILTVLIQSSFDITSIGQLNYINPSATLGRNALFALINGIGQAVFYSLSSSVFAFAYLKYSKSKTASQ